MKNEHRINFLLPSFVFFMLISCKQPVKISSYLVSFLDTTKNEYGYKDQHGNVVIPQGKYEFCFTDTFKTFAIVLKPNIGFVAIDRQEKVLYNVYSFDNGPDYASEGLFRIIENNKIGYADAITGEVVIKPQFECAFLFEDGKAKVSKNCKINTVGEHNEWQSDNWIFIDKTGKNFTAQN